MSKYTVGIDVSAGDDMSAYTVVERPGRIRRFLRRIKLDRSTWEYRVVDSWVEPPLPKEGL